MFTEEYIKGYVRENVNRDVEKEDPTDVRVMSSNVLFGKWEKVPEGLTAEERATILTEYYLRYKPDLLGLQEMDPSIYDLIVERLKDEYAVPETEIKGPCIFTPTLYRKADWEPLKTGFHRFRRGWCWQYHWCLYQSKKDPDTRVIHIKFHYPPSEMPYVESRCEAVVELNTEIRRLIAEYPQTPIFLSGDYNVSVGMAEYYGTFARDVKMQSGMLLTDDNDGYEVGWHPVGELPTFSAKAIDHISVTEETVRVKRHRKIRDDLILFGSDHYPIFLDVELLKTTIC